MDQQNLPYSEAISNLENILGLMQSPNCDIDNLSAYTTQAISLLKYCRAKLTKCDEELKKSRETLFAYEDHAGDLTVVEGSPAFIQEILEEENHG